MTTHLNGADYAELRRIAEEATPGPWEVTGSSSVTDWRDHSYTMEWIANGTDNEDGTNCNYEADAAFIATFNPARVLSMLEALEAAERQLGEVREGMRKAEAWFRDYARQHRFKGTVDGNVKAQTNEERADFLAALSSLPCGGDEGSSRTESGGSQPSAAKSDGLCKPEWANLIAAEFAKPQFMTTEAQGGEYRLIFHFDHTGAAERCHALEDAFRAAGRAINGPAQ
jgi:hypothetical protein